MRFSMAFVSALGAATVLTALAIGEMPPSAVAGFTFLVSASAAFAAVCSLFLIVSRVWAPPLVEAALPVSFAPLALGLLLSIPVVSIASAFERPCTPWFSDTAVTARAAVGCATLFTLAWLGLRRVGRPVAPFFLMCFLLIQTAFSWDFGMTLQPHWHDTIFAPFWIVGSVLAGMCLLVLFSLARATALKLAGDDFDRFGCFLLAFALLHGYFLYAQILTVWYGNLPSEVGAMHERLDGSYQALFWIVVAATIVTPILLLVFRPIRRNRWTCSAIASTVLVGLWLERLWIVLPAQVGVH